MPRLLALDPGLATFGAACLDPRGAILAADAIATSSRPAPSRDKTVAKVADRARRSSEVARWLRDFVELVRPDVAIAEAGMAAGKPGETAVASLAIGVGIVGVVLADLGVEVLWSTPREWRRYFVPAPAPRQSRSKPPSKKAIAKHARDCAVCREAARCSVESRCTNQPQPKAPRLIKSPPTPSDAELYGAIGQVCRRVVDADLAARGRAASLWPHAMDAAGLGRWAIERCAPVRVKLSVDHGGL